LYRHFGIFKTNLGTLVETFLHYCTEMYCILLAKHCESVRI